MVTPYIKASSISLHYGAKTILNHLDIEILPQKIIALIGPNGGGKTSFIRILLKLLKPSSGTVWHQPKLRIGYMPQKMMIDPIFPIHVQRLLELSGPPWQEAAHLTKIESLLKTQLTDLSGGELQRVLLARALVRKPQLLVLDEPMQGVDVHGQAELYDLLSLVHKQLKCAILLVSHDLHIVMAKTDMVYCINGHICCHGTPETIEQHPEYVALFGREHKTSFAVYTHDHDHAHE